MVAGEKMNWLKKMLLELNKRGVSATVITVILIVVGLAIVVLFVIFMGQSGKESILDLLDKGESAYEILVDLNLLHALGSVKVPSSLRD